MLKGIDPLLTPDLLKVLAEMGHGDEIVIADANFTAASLGRGKPVITCPARMCSAPCEAVLSLLPLDASVAQPVAYMQVCDTPAGYRSALQRDVVAALQAGGQATPAQCEAMERFAFYDRVKAAFAIVHTGDLQPYGNFILKKGVIAEARCMTPDLSHPEHRPAPQRDLPTEPASSRPGEAGRGQLRPRGSSQGGLRQYNERVVLQAIRLHGELPGAEMARSRSSPQPDSVLITKRPA
jgi:L-fucose mutarotase